MIEQKQSQPDVLAIIPARGGSKGLPRKNTLMLGDRPLMAWSVSVALAARNITRVVVSTDDEEIAAIAREYGAEVPFLRPANLSGDRAEVAQALQHIRNGLFELEQYRPRAQMVFYPTHPFRRRSTVEHLVDMLLTGHETVSTVRQINTPAERYFLEKDGMLHPYDDPKSAMSAVAHVRTYGYCYGRSLHFSCAGHYQHVLRDAVELIDIDSSEDLELARKVLQNNLFDFEL